MPTHIHVEKDNCTAKYNIKPIELVHSKGFKATELKKIRSIVNDNIDLIESKWDEYFNN